MEKTNNNLIWIPFSVKICYLTCSTHVDLIGKEEEEVDKEYASLKIKLSTSTIINTIIFLGNLKHGPQNYSLKLLYLFIIKKIYLKSLF